MKNEKISIIMPIYNAENYMVVSIDSILKQTYSNFELLLIDDGSTDNSLSICKDYEKKDDRIKVFSQKNSGCAAARNLGLSKVKGKYISFVDSDDIINENLLSILYDNLINTNSDISICNFEEFFDKVPETTELSSDYLVYNNEEAIKVLNLEDKFTLALWSKLYRAELFEGERFPLIKTSSDNFIAYRLLFKSERIVYTPSKYYYYKINNQSITHANKNININIFYEGIKIIDFVRENLPSQYETTVYKYLFLSLGVYNSMIIKNNINLDYVKAIRDNVLIWKKTIQGKVKISKKRYFQMNLFCFNISLYNFFYKFLKK